MAESGPSQGASPKPPSNVERKDQGPVLPPEEREARRLTLAFLSALRDYEPKDERARITLRILTEQFFDVFGGNLRKLAQEYNDYPSHALVDQEAKKHFDTTRVPAEEWERMGPEDRSKIKEKNVAFHMVLAKTGTPIVVEKLLTAPQKNPLAKNGKDAEIEPILVPINKVGMLDEGTFVTDNWMINRRALDKHLEQYLEWLDGVRQVEGAKGLDFGEAKNLIVHVLGDRDRFNMKIAGIMTDIEALRKQEFGMNRNLARGDLRATIRNELEEAGVQTSSIGIEIRDALSNKDGTIDIVLDEIRIVVTDLTDSPPKRSNTRVGAWRNWATHARPGGLYAGPVVALPMEMQAELQKFIARHLNLKFLRSPRHTSWVSFHPDFKLVFRDADDKLTGSIPREELGLDLPLSPAEALVEIGREINKISQGRSRVLSPYQQKGRWRVVMTDVENYELPIQERFAPKRVEELVFQMMRHDPKFREGFLNGKLRISQIFGDVKTDEKAPGLKALVDMRKKRGRDPYGVIGYYTEPKMLTEDEARFGVVGITPSSLQRRRRTSKPVKNKEGEWEFPLMHERIFADWERHEETLEAEIEQLKLRLANIVNITDLAALQTELIEKERALPSGTEKFSRIRAFYSALSAFSYPNDPRIESFVRSFGTIIVHDSILARLGEIGKLLADLSIRGEKATLAANVYFNHYYSIFDEMNLASPGDSRGTVELNVEELARHAEEYLAWRGSNSKKESAPKTGTNIFRLAQTHFSIKDSGLKERADTITKKVNEEKVKEAALSPEVKKLMQTLEEKADSVRDYAHGITLRPEDSNFDEMRAQRQFLDIFLERIAESVVSLREQKPDALEMAKVLDAELAEIFSET